MIESHPMPECRPCVICEIPHRGAHQRCLVCVNNWFYTRAERQAFLDSGKEEYTKFSIYRRRCRCQRMHSSIYRECLMCRENDDLRRTAGEI